VRHVMRLREWRDRDKGHAEAELVKFAHDVG
jgi:hypothetical protein